ncbi:MAG: hypothetical protein ABIV50_15920 [Opitutus sp.]
MRSVLQNINASATASKFAEALAEIVTFMDRVHETGGPLEKLSQKWRAGRSNVDHLPGIHERVQRCVSSAEEVSAALADLEEELIELEDQKPEVDGLLSDMRALLREVAPKCLTVALLIVLSGWLTRQYWLMAVGAIPLFPLIRGGTGVFKLRAYLFRVEHGIEAVNEELKTTRALEAERKQFESLLAQNLEMFRLTIGKTLDALEAEAVVADTSISVG